MLLNLSDVFSSQIKELAKDIPIEMDVFDDGMERYDILQKTPVSFIFTNIGVGKVKVTGSAELVLRMRCDRCLKEVEQKIPLSFTVEVSAPDVPLEEMDDQIFIDGYSLDVEELVSNEIIMSLPAKVICKPDCKGICKVCGKDLNLGECGCDTFVPDPRMAAIKDIFNANKEV